MKKILKVSLFIIAFCLLLLFLNNSNVQAADVTTVQELQETMGAEGFSTIEGTTLKITNDFTWKILTETNLKIPELTIDFNGKKITIDNDYSESIKIQEGKIILKDTTENIGGFYCNEELSYDDDNIFDIVEGVELIVENGLYDVETSNRFLFSCSGGNITIRNGVFQGLLVTIHSGEVIIFNGSFSNPGLWVDGTYHNPGDSKLTIHDGIFNSENTLLTVRVGRVKVSVNILGGTFTGSYFETVSLIADYFPEETSGKGYVTIDGAVISSLRDALNLFDSNHNPGFENIYEVNILNATLESDTTYGKRSDFWRT